MSDKKSKANKKTKQIKLPSRVNLVWAEGLSTNEIYELREEVDRAIKDPDHNIVCNYEVHWEIIPVKKNPIRRIIWSDSLAKKDVNDLAQQVDMALVDPDFAIVTNYEVHWDEK